MEPGCSILVSLPRHYVRINESIDLPSALQFGPNEAGYMLNCGGDVTKHLASASLLEEWLVMSCFFDDKQPCSTGGVMHYIFVCGMFRCDVFRPETSLL